MYNKIKIYGDSDINYIWSLKSKAVTNEFIDSIQSKGIYTPTWDNNTVMLANFVKDISGSTFDQDKMVIGYKVSKKEVDSQRYMLVDYTRYDETQIIDYNVKNRTPYIYSITPIYNINGTQVMGESILSEPIICDWEVYSIIGLIPTEDEKLYRVDKDNIWSFFCNIQGGDFSIVNKKQYSDGFKRYSKSYTTETDYLETSFNCYLGDISCSSMSYTDDNINRLEKWRQFCNSDCLKVFKDMKGHVIVCDISSSSYSVDGNISDLPTTITVNIKEMKDYKDISICEVI